MKIQTDRNDLTGRAATSGRRSVTNSAIALSLFTLFTSLSARADVTERQGVSSSWNDAGAWTNGVPTSLMDTWIRNGSTVDILSGSAVAGQLLLGNGSTLNINGGTLSQPSDDPYDDATVGHGSGDSKVTVTGPNSKWSGLYYGPGNILLGGKTLWVGGYTGGGHTSIEISGGGKVEFGRVIIGGFSDALSKVSVKGAGSQLLLHHPGGGHASVGAFYGDMTTPAELLVADGGAVTFAGGSTVMGIGGQGKVKIGEGQAAGTIDVGSISGMIVNGYVPELELNHNESSYVLSTRLWGALKVVHEGTGKTTIGGSDNTYSGGTTVRSGTLVAGSASAMGTGNVVIQGGTFLLAEGVTISNTIVLAGGTFAQGLSSGTQFATLGSFSGDVSGGSKRRRIFWVER